MTQTNSLRVIRVVVFDVGTPSEQTVSFPRLSLYESNEVGAEVLAHREAVAKAAAREAGLTPPELFNVLFEIRAKAVTAPELVALCDRFDVTHKVLDKALAKGGVADAAARKAVIAKFGTPDAIGLARDLILDDSEEDRQKRSDEAKAKEEAEKAKAEALQRPLPVTPSISPLGMIDTPAGPIPEPAGYGSPATGE